MKKILKKILPKSLIYRIQHSKQFNKRVAGRYARESKRVDICSAQFAHYLNLSDHLTLSNKVCLEIGAGWVLSHAIVCYLLGAKKVLVTDIYPYAHPEALYQAIHESINYVPRDILSLFEDHSLIRSRFDNLLSIRHFDFEVLRKLGIEYIAPIDFAKVRLNVPVDFVYSISALEHVPYEDVPMVLQNIDSDLKPGGTMIHCIHLEDHKDTSNAPFDFLSISAAEYSRSVQSLRGNRIRKSRWQELFGALSNTSSKLIYEWTRNNKELPEHIEQSLFYKNKADLRVSHIGMYTKKYST